MDQPATVVELVFALELDEVAGMNGDPIDEVDVVDDEDGLVAVEIDDESLVLIAFEVIVEDFDDYPDILDHGRVIFECVAMC